MRSRELISIGENVYTARAMAISAIFSVAKHASTDLGESIKALGEASDLLDKRPVPHNYRYLQTALVCLKHLLNWTAGVKAAEVDADRHLRAAKAIAKDLQKALTAEGSNKDLAAIADSLTSVSDSDQISDIAEKLLRVPLPIPLLVPQPRMTVPSVRGDIPVQQSSSPTSKSISLAFVSFSIGTSALSNPHPIEPDTIYDLHVEVSLSAWPEEICNLVLEVVSVEPTMSYEFPKFTFPKPLGSHPYSLSGTGRMRVLAAQDAEARPLQFSYRAHFDAKASNIKVLTEGPRHLSFESLPRDRKYLSHFARVSDALLSVRQLVRSHSGIPDEETAYFLRFLGALGEVGATALQDKTFPGVWKEKDFQIKVTEFLRMNRRIGPDLEVHANAAGGITDLSYNRVRCELKVEGDHPVRIECAKEHYQQLVQYAVGSDRRFGIVGILDNTVKQEAPGLVTNDIGVIAVAPPNNPNGVPVLVGVVIIRGNLATPSSL
jgi:hypothetical protein